MAKPIEATPELRGKDAERFLRRVNRTNRRKKMTKKEKRVVKLLLEGVE